METRLGRSLKSLGQWVRESVSPEQIARRKIKHEVGDIQIQRGSTVFVFGRTVAVGDVPLRADGSAK